MGPLKVYMILWPLCFFSRTGYQYVFFFFLLIFSALSVFLVSHNEYYNKVLRSLTSHLSLSLWYVYKNYFSCIEGRRDWNPEFCVVCTPG